MSASPPDHESPPNGDSPGAHHFFTLIDAIRSAGKCEAWMMAGCDADPYMPPNPWDPWGICLVCKRLPTSRHCSRCGRDRVCCKSCEDYMLLANKPHEDITAHVRLCAHRYETTADIIVAAVTGDEVPTHPQATEDYGFNRCPEPFDRIRLFTLYCNLVGTLGVTSQELNAWMQDGTLYECIDAKIHAKPLEFSPQICAWFAQKKVIFERPTADPKA
ncbi:hypothetical protein CKAH01_15573 [Colletotrichum kahawae]|uniref:Suppressor of anucleate metulae protein B n=1 Tax=Colletotrichum kahawae TaxID=34407 RepID=A0AAE0D821_COLKA|nr:hypothetical protein CKAH01_15573 [Colletotrichum kahawae]